MQIRELYLEAKILEEPTYQIETDFDPSCITHGMATTGSEDLKKAYGRKETSGPNRMVTTDTVRINDESIQQTRQCGARQGLHVVE